MTEKTGIERMPVFLPVQFISFNGMGQTVFHL